MIKTIIEYRVRIEYEDDIKDELYRETRQGYLQHALEHVRQENMLNCKHGATNWADVWTSRVVTSEVMK